MRCIDKSKCLDPALLYRATKLMHGDSEAACQWMQVNLEIFDWESPLVHAVSDKGRIEVFQYIDRLEREAH